MGWLTILPPSVAVYLLFKTGHTVLMVIAIINCVGCFWSLGVMLNYATDLAKQRLTYSNGFYDITKREANAVPNWITVVQMIFSLAGLVLLIIGIVFVGTDQ